MKNILYLIFVGSSFLAYGQKKSFVYEVSYNYRFQTNSLDTNSRKNEEMLLFVNEEESYFVGRKKLEFDEAISKIDVDSNPTINMQSLPRVLVKFEVEKNKKSNSGSYFERIFQNTFQVAYDFKAIHWQLSEGTKKIDKYICRQAFATFAGRHYTAWYSEEIPIFDGPYKFQGLPGLILEIYDDKKEHYFTLNTLKKVNTVLKIDRQKVIEASMKDVVVAKATLMENLKSSGISIAIDPKVEREAKERNLKNRNYIEIIK